MMALLVVFFLLVGIFGVIGMMRGWAKELLVSFSVVLALFIIYLFTSIMPITKDILAKNPTLTYWIQVGTLFLMVFFGYQTPKLSFFARSAGRRDKITDALLGLFFGLINGYLIVGSLWYWTNEIGYFPQYGIFPPDPNTAMGAAAIRWIPYMPPPWLGTAPNILIAITLAFIFIIVVFI